MQAAFPGDGDLPDDSALSGKDAFNKTRSAEMSSKASRQTQGTPQQPECSREGRPSCPQPFRALLQPFRTQPHRRDALWLAGFLPWSCLPTSTKRLRKSSA